MKNPIARKVIGYAFAIVFIVAGWWITAVLVDSPVFATPSAALEALAYQVGDLVAAMEDDAGAPMRALNVDGGASANNFLMQFQADILDRPILRPTNTETTALGAAYLAGLSTGFWPDVDALRALRASDETFKPAMEEAPRHDLLEGWKRAVGRVMP